MPLGAVGSVREPPPPTETVYLLRRGRRLLARRRDRRNRRRRCSHCLPWTARRTPLAMPLQFFLPLQFFIQPHGQVLDHRIRHLQPALQFLHHFAVRGLDHHVHKVSLVQFLHAVRHALPAPFRHRLDLRTLVPSSALQGRNYLVDVRLRRIRPANKNQVVLTLFHMSSIPRLLLRNFRALKLKPHHSESSSSLSTRRLYFAIALSAPSATINSTASAASAAICAAISRSGFRIVCSTYSAMSSSGYSGFTPSRTRINSFDPTEAMIDFKPLCPPALPRSRIRSMPHGNAASSLSTIISAALHSYPSSSIRTAAPLRFIIVCGLASTTSLPAMLPSPTYDFASGRVTRIPARPPNASTAKKPQLCGVNSYSGPGFPRPTISLIFTLSVRR